MPGVDVDGGRLFYREWGSGPLVVFAHGFGSDHRLWDAIEPYLGGRRCVALDLRGWGSSTPVPGPSTSIEALGDDLYAAIRGLGAEAVDLVGFSMGGFGVLGLWERHPEVVRTAALVSARANGDSEEQRAGRDRLIETLQREGRSEAAGAFVPLTAAEHADPFLVGRLRTMFEDQPYETLISALRGMRDRADRMALMATMTVPTLVAVGEEDPLVPLELAKRMVSEAPAASLVVAPGAGHSTPLEAPETLAQALRTLWAGG